MPPTEITIVTLQLNICLMVFGSFGSILSFIHILNYFMLKHKAITRGGHCSLHALSLAGHFTMKITSKTTFLFPTKRL